MEEEKEVYEVPSGDNSIQEEDSLNEFENIVNIVE